MNATATPTGPADLPGIIAWPCRVSVSDAGSVTDGAGAEWSWKNDAELLAATKAEAQVEAVCTAAEAMMNRIPDDKCYHTSRV